MKQRHKGTRKWPIKRIVLDLHDVIADSKKVVVFEYEMPLFFLSWKPVEAWSKIWKQSTEHKARRCGNTWRQSTGLRSRVVYKFACAGCNACYVGETTRHFSTRVREHLVTDKASHIFKHLQNSGHCRALCSSVDCFHILDHASTGFQLKIKEASCKS